MDNLFTPQGEVPQPISNEVPSYLAAADNHTIGNTLGGSWFDPSTWETKLGNGGKLLATSVLSGANSFYNTGITVGNWFGAGLEERQTDAWISSIDSDFGQYYQENRAAADLGGFIIGSLLPGIGGVKILNMGQRALQASKGGFLGFNLGRATGLLAPQTDIYLARAGEELAKSANNFKTITQAGYKALASGVYQNVLEGVAFETAIQATMFKSPILEEQNGYDILKNIAMGGVFQGVVGGAFSSAINYGALKAARNKVDSLLRPWSDREVALEGVPSAHKIILYTEDKAASLRAMEEFQTAGKEGVGEDLVQNITGTHFDKLRRIDNDIRTEYHKMNVSDPQLANMLADAHLKLSPTEALQNLAGSLQVARLADTTLVEEELKDALKAGKPIDRTKILSYVKLTGEDAGKVTDSTPAIQSIADTVKQADGQSLKDAVLKEVRSWKFNPTDLWSSFKLDKLSAHTEAEARYIYADHILHEIKPGSQIGDTDFPFLQRALRDGVLDIKTYDSQKRLVRDGFSSKVELELYIEQQKQKVAAQLGARSFRRGVDVDTTALSKILDVPVSTIEGTWDLRKATPGSANEANNKAYQAFRESRGLQVSGEQELETRFLPSYAKISRTATNIKDTNGHQIDGMTFFKSQEVAHQQNVDNVFAANAGEFAAIHPTITDSQLQNASRTGGGPGLAAFANGAPGSLSSALQAIGAITSGLRKAFRSTTQEVLEGPLFKLLSNQKVAIEVEKLNQIATRAGEPLVRYTEQSLEDGKKYEYLVSKEGLKQAQKEEKAIAKAAEESGEEYTPGDAITAFLQDSKKAFLFEHPETAEVIDAHMARTADRTTTFGEIHAAQGMEDAKDPLVYRPIRPNPKDYPYFAFVVDPKVTGQGHKTMIFANSPSKLQELINKVERETTYDVITDTKQGVVSRTKSEIEDFKRAQDEYEYQRTLHENYINAELSNKGIMSEYFTKTDPKVIADRMLQQHLREDDTLARELVRMKNQKTFDWLEDQGKSFTKVSSSKFGSYSDRIESSEGNPYVDHIKLALDLSKISDYPRWQGLNKLLDGKVSQVVGAIREQFDAWKNPLDADQVTKINSLVQRYGMNTGYSDAADLMLINHTAPKGELTKFVRAANSMLSTLTLGLDPLNALNNHIGAWILRGTELKQITDAIAKGNTEIAGKLAELTKTTLPDGTSSITTPTKLISKAITNFFKDDGTLANQYTAMGLNKSITDQFKDMIGDFALQGTETVGQLQSRLRSAFVKAKALSEKGEVLSGNRWSEQFNRFVSADVMRQLTDLGVEAGLLTKGDQFSYINTFVNRVEGTTIASQRPLIFQGPIGQAVGLFQSYQFNLMQQMFRYVAEGTKKDAAMLLGLQGTFYGMQGLPAFQAINQHVIGTMSGNKNHIDLYDSIYGIAGKDAGDLITYGLPSNLLRANLYSRGDINPRQVTVLPTALKEIPFIGAFGKFLGSMQDAMGKIGNGGQVWESFLQGLEHNGLSRPLAGLAQVLQAAGPDGQVYSTSSKGSILFSNDLVSIATGVRLAGGRPIQEAIVNDGVFRMQVYQQYDHAKMRELGEAIKSASIQGNQPSDDSVIRFTQAYAANGGKQQNFNRFMMNEIKGANTSQAQKITQQLQNPLSQKVQLLMNDGNGNDLSNF